MNFIHFIAKGFTTVKPKKRTTEIIKRVHTVLSNWDINKGRKFSWGVPKKFKDKAEEVTTELSFHEDKWASWTGMFNNTGLILNTISIQGHRRLRRPLNYIIIRSRPTLFTSSCKDLQKFVSHVF